MLDSGQSPSESATSSSIGWSDESIAAPVPTVAESELTEALETWEMPLIIVVPKAICRDAISGQYWTVACIASFTGHLWTVLAFVCMAFVWELLVPESFLPPGAAAGGRPRGSNPAGIIGVAPGYQEGGGEFEFNGGVITLGAPQQMGNQVASEPDVDGYALEAKKETATQVAAISPTEPIELPVSEVPAVSEQVAARTTDVRPPENKPENVPRAAISRRVATTRIATELTAAKVDAPAPQEIPLLEVLPEATTRAEATSDSVATLTESKVATPQQPTTQSAPSSSLTSERSRASTGTAGDAPKAPTAPEASEGLARRAGTKVLAAVTTKADLDFPGSGGGLGGPGGNGGAGGRGGTINDGPGGSGTGRTHGGGGDLNSLVIHAPKPHYPRELDDAGISGKVLVHVEIDAAGNVTGVKLHRTSGYQAFDRSALEGVGRWKFARLADKPWRSSVYLVPVYFRD